MYLEAIALVTAATTQAAGATYVPRICNFRRGKADAIRLVNGDQLEESRNSPG